MKQKNLLILLFLCLTIQLAFSFYYNSQIIDQNKLLQQQQITYQQLLTDNQLLTQKLSQINSLDYLNRLIKTKNFQPINNTLRIQKN